MTETTLLDRPEIAQPIQAGCDECAGSGGWFRYAPSEEPSTGTLYLSCLGCRGSGRLSFPRS